jgi:hypothetical protein
VVWWLNWGRCGGLIGKVWWLNLGRCGGLIGKVWWLNGSAPDCCPAVPGSNPASPQPTADCQSSGGLPPGIALGCELASARGDRGENYINTKNICIKKKKNEVYTVQITKKRLI